MGFSINKITLVGKLGRDSETRQTTNDLNVTTFSMATEHSVKTGDDWKNETTWHKVIFFGLSDFYTKALRKGAEVFVSGRQSNRSYEDKEGNKKYVSEVIGDKRDFIIFKSPTNGERTSAPVTNTGDEVPF